MLNPDQVAAVCHETNRAYCLQLGDTSQPSWADAPDWQKNSARNGVIFHLNNPGAPPSRSHELWLEQKRNEGWSYGPVKDPEKKLHPCFLPYSGLPASQQIKDALFIAVVEALRPMTGPYSAEQATEPPHVVLSGRPLNAGEMIDEIRGLRRDLHGTEIIISSLKAGFASADLSNRPGVSTSTPAADRGEILANCTIAYRHVEDARMRLGKVIQAYDGGVSVYDKKS